MPGKNRFEKRYQEYSEITNTLDNIDYREYDHIREELEHLNGLLENFANRQEDEDILDDEDKKNIVGAYNALLRDVGKVYDDLTLDYQKNRKDHPLREKYGRLMKIMAKDQQAFFLSLQNNTKQTVEEILDSSRSKVITLDKKIEELPSVGGNQSRRYRMKMETENGPKDGFFTENKKTPALSVDFLDKEFDRVADKYGISSDLKQAFVQSGIIGLKKGSYRGIVGSSMSLHEHVTGLNTQQMAEKFTPILEKKNDVHGLSIINEHGTPQVMRAYLEYMRSVVNLEFPFSMNRSLGINNNSNLNKRNSAMSAVAGLLGCGNVIAHSENVHIKTNQDGKEVTTKGNFMEEAKGVDVLTVTADNPVVGCSYDSLKQDGLVKNIADLQVLDYLCGNPDRHGGNFLYKYENGKLLGIVGIDNDTSFGSQYHEERFNYSIKLDNLKVIPADTADKIMKMDDESFRYMLYGYELSPKEADRAVERLHNLQETIRMSREVYKNEKPGKLIPKIPKVCTKEEMNAFDIPTQLGLDEKGGYDKSSIFGTVTVKFGSGMMLKNAIANVHDSIVKDLSKFPLDYSGDLFVTSKELMHNSMNTVACQTLLQATYNIRDYMNQDFCMLTWQEQKKKGLPKKAVLNQDELKEYRDKIKDLERAAKEFLDSEKNNNYEPGSKEAKCIKMAEKLQKLAGTMKETLDRAEENVKKHNEIVEKKYPLIKAAQGIANEPTIARHYLDRKPQEERENKKALVAPYLKRIAEQKTFMEQTLANIRNAQGVSAASIEKELKNIGREAEIKTLEYNAALAMEKALTEKDCRDDAVFRKGLASALVLKKLELEKNPASPENEELLKFYKNVDTKKEKFSAAVDELMNSRSLDMLAKGMRLDYISEETVRDMAYDRADFGITALTDEFERPTGEIELNISRRKLDEEIGKGIRCSIDNFKNFKNDIAFKRGMAAALTKYKLDMIDDIAKANDKESADKLKKWNELKDIDIDVANFEQSLNRTMESPAFKKFVENIKAGSFRTADIISNNEDKATQMLENMAKKYTEAKKEVELQAPKANEHNHGRGMGMN